MRNSWIIRKPFRDIVITINPTSPEVNKAINLGIFYAKNDKKGKSVDISRTIRDIAKIMNFSNPPKRKYTPNTFFRGTQLQQLESPIRKNKKI